MEIRTAEKKDLERIMEIYRFARKAMRKNGNPSQWGEHFPPREIIEDDIIKGQCYLCTEQNKIEAVFAFVIGSDPTYKVIEGGAWLNDKPYGTIHRIASGGTAKGVLASCVDFCKTKTDNIRIDTHRDNRIMQHLIEKLGFEQCGIIYAYDGSERIAYQLALENRTNV